MNTYEVRIKLNDDQDVVMEKIARKKGKNVQVYLQAMGEPIVMEKVLLLTILELEKEINGNPSRVLGRLRKLKDLEEGT